MQKPRVLFTGFEQGASEPSCEIIDCLDGKIQSGYIAVGRILPSDSSRIRSALAEQILSVMPAAVVCLGGGQRLSLPSYAQHPGTDSQRRSTLPLGAILYSNRDQQIRADDLPCAEPLHNQTMWHVLGITQQREGLNILAGFVELPDASPETRAVINNIGHIVAKSPGTLLN